MNAILLQYRQLHEFYVVVLVHDDYEKGSMGTHSALQAGTLVGPQLFGGSPGSGVARDLWFS